MKFRAFETTKLAKNYFWCLFWKMFEKRWNIKCIAKDPKHHYRAWSMNSFLTGIVHIIWLNSGFHVHCFKENSTLSWYEWRKDTSKTQNIHQKQTNEDVELFCHFLNNAMISSRKIYQLFSLNGVLIRLNSVL